MSELSEFADSIWRGERPTLRGNPMGQRTSEVFLDINDHVAYFANFGNVSAITTDEGLVLVDCGSPITADNLFRVVREWSDQPVHTIIYTHGHFDHVHGAHHFDREARDKGWPLPRVVAHRKVVDRFDRYRYTQGLNQVVNRRQFNSADLVWNVDFRYPDVTYDNALTLSVGGRTFELTHQMGETDDATLIWMPEDRIVLTGDLFIWVTPNCGNPQKVQRFAREWAQALRTIAGLGAEVLLPGHGLPIFGGDKILQTMEETAEYLEYLETETVRRMNEGWRLNDIVAEVKPPAHLAERPYLKPLYDEPEFVVRNIWRRYAGWWDGNAARLKPADDRLLAAEYASLAGGVAALCQRARTLIATGVESDERIAGHLAEMAWLAAPEDGEAREVRRLVNQTRAERASSTMSRGVFWWAVRETDGSDY